MKKDLSTIDVFKFHLKMFKEDKEGYMVVIFILNMIVTGSIPLLAVILPKYIIDAISGSMLTEALVFVAIFGLSSMILSVISVKLSAISSGKFSASRLRRSRMYNEKFRNVSMEHLESSDFHSARSEAFNTMQYVSHGYQGTLRTVFQQLPEIFTIIGFIVILGLFNPWIIVVAFGCAIAQFFLALKSKHYEVSKHKIFSDRNRISNYYYGVTHDFTYGKDIRINKLSKPLKKLYKEKSNRVLDWLRGRDINEYKYSLFDVIFLLITNGFSYYLIINAYFKGVVTLGTVSMTIMTVLGITMKLQNTFKELANLKDFTASTKKYINFFNDDYCFDIDTLEAVDTKDMKIEFKNVSFKYPSSDQYVLSNISFTINPKQKIALVGINGSGKGKIRNDELCPFEVTNKKNGNVSGGKTDIYFDFIISELMPIINQKYRTKETPEYTGMLGISLGGLCSLYASAKLSSRFSRFAFVSSAHIRVKNELIELLEKEDFNNVLKLYSDVGTKESSNEAVAELFVISNKEIYEILDTKPNIKDFKHSIIEGSKHETIYWNERFSDIIDFMFE